VLLQKGPLTVDGLQKESHLSADEIVQIVNQLIKEGKTQILHGDGKHIRGSTLIIHEETLNRITGRIFNELSLFHEKNPLKRGMLKEEVKSRLKLDPRYFQLLIAKMASDGKLVEDAAYLHLADFKIRYTSEQRAQINNLQILFDQNSFAPPTIADCIAVVGEEVFNVLVENETYLRLSQDVVFDPKNLEKLHQIVLKYFAAHPTLSVAEFRDLVGTSRKYALAALEYFDEKEVTLRKGESRVLMSKPLLTD